MKIINAIRKLESLKRKNPGVSVSVKVINKKQWVSRPVVVSYRKRKKYE